MIEVQDIFARHIEAYRHTHTLFPNQAKAVKAILSCRTSALGAHIDTCDECGFEKISYNSCRNRHCPKCQTIAKERWIDAQRQNLLNSQYFHVVFTLPDTLNRLIYLNQERMYGLFFKAMSETILELCDDPKYLGATPGITAVLHTWGQNLAFHPHLHCIVTGGGLTKTNTWKSSRKKFFIPVKVLSRKLRGKFLYYLKQAGLKFDSTLYSKEWIVYCKKPFGNAEKVVSYLGRYTHRVAISNNRILRADDDTVTFSWRDYRDDNRNKVMSLQTFEFIRRFLTHVLPCGFRKIRHYGIFASRDKFKRIKLCKKLTHTKQTIAPVESVLDKLAAILGENWNLCPCCGIGRLGRDPPHQEN